MSALSGQVNVSVANVYRKPTYLSDIVTQAILGETITVLDRQKPFTLIRLADEYEGWLSDYQWVAGDTAGVEKKQIRSHQAPIYEQPDDSSRRIRAAVIGVNLAVAETEKDWSRVILPDGVRGWLKSNHFGSFPELSRGAVINLAQEFFGYPYFWGGRTVNGLDCSGLTQTVFSLLGNQLPRDSWMQQTVTRFVSKDPLEAAKADLYFFAEADTKITHVGIAAGEGKIIHARGIVRVNSMKEGDTDYSPELVQTLVDVRTVF